MISGIDAIQPGWKVITADNENAGEIEELGGSEFIVRKGWLFPSDHRLPISTIAQVDPVDQQVYLSITKDQVEGLAAGTWTYQETASPMTDPRSWATGGVTDLDAPTTSSSVTDPGYAATGATSDSDDTVRLQEKLRVEGDDELIERR
jgi:hypothetical protein